MATIFKKIENEIARRMTELSALRSALKSADQNNVWEQSRLQIEVAILSRELEAIERMYAKLREDK